MLSYRAECDNSIDGSLGAKACVASLSLEGKGSSKLQIPVGKLSKQEVDVKKLLLSADKR